MEVLFGQLEKVRLALPMCSISVAHMSMQGVSENEEIVTFIRVRVLVVSYVLRS